MVGSKRPAFTKIVSPAILTAVYAFSYIPILALIITSFNSSGLASKWGSFSLKWYQKFFASSEMLSALWASLLIAFVSTLISVILGFFIVVASKWWRPRWLFAIFHPSVILPEIVMAVGILSLFVSLRASLGYNSVITGHTLVGLGFVVPMLRAKFEAIDSRLLEASLDLGATHIQTFLRILTPLMFPTVVSAAFLAFTFSLDDFFLAYFCSGPTLETVSLYVYSKIIAVADPSINAMSAVLFALSAAVALVLLRTKVIDSHDFQV